MIASQKALRFEICHLNINRLWRFQRTAFQVIHGPGLLVTNILHINTSEVIVQESVLTHSQKPAHAPLGTISPVEIPRADLEGSGILRLHQVFGIGQILCSSGRPFVLLEAFNVYELNTDPIHFEVDFCSVAIIKIKAGT